MSTPKRAGESPIKVELEAGKRYAWCTCGLSTNQPFCDGAHRADDTALTPLVFVAEKDETRYLCTCKASKNGAFCDGSHAK